MSILNYFCHEKWQQGKFLPSSSDFSNDLSSSLRAKNQQVSGHYTALHGPKYATLYFEKLLGHGAPESICRKFRDAYKKEVQKQAKELGPCDAIEVTELPKKTPRKGSDAE